MRRSAAITATRPNEWCIAEAVRKLAKGEKWPKHIIIIIEFSKYYKYIILFQEIFILHIKMEKRKTDDNNKRIILPSKMITKMMTWKRKIKSLYIFFSLSLYYFGFQLLLMYLSTSHSTFFFLETFFYTWLLFYLLYSIYMVVIFFHRNTRLKNF